MRGGQLTLKHVRAHTDAQQAGGCEIATEANDKFKTGKVGAAYQNKNVGAGSDAVTWSNRRAAAGAKTRGGTICPPVRKNVRRVWFSRQ